jgi:hypothetical protein
MFLRSDDKFAGKQFLINMLEKATTTKRNLFEQKREMEIALKQAPPKEFLLHHLLYLNKRHSS